MRDRYHVVERVLYHHKKCAASAMLAKLFEVCPKDKRPRDDENIYPAPWTDAQVKRDGEPPAKELPPHVVHLSDHGLIDYLGRPQMSGDAKELRKRLSLGLQYRKLYRTLLVVDVDLAKESSKGKDFFANRFRGMSDDAQSAEEAQTFRTQFERDLALLAYPDKPEKYGSVLIYCPSNKMQAKEIDVRTELEPEIVRPLRMEEDQFALHQDIAALKKYYSDLWRMYIFVEPEIYADDAKCMKIIEAFAEKCEIRDLEEAFRKARKPQLLKLYGTKVVTIQPRAQTEIPWSESETVVREAARGKARKDGEAGRTATLPSQQFSDEGDAVLTDNEFFRGLVPTLANSSKQDDHLAGLTVFLEEEKLGKLTRYCDYLRFIDRTCEHWKHDPNRLLSKETLKRWFREHRDNEFGSAP